VFLHLKFFLGGRQFHDHDNVKEVMVCITGGIIL
jgi:hypothetical protein